MDLGLAGKRALVTAASQGLGRAVATQLAREGCQVVISSRRADRLQEVAHEICVQAGVPAGTVQGVAADVTSPEDVRTLVAEAVSRLGGIDLLLTNAGGPPRGNFDEVTDAQWQDAFEMNLMSAVRLIRETLPIMRRQGGGRIINISSVYVRQPNVDLILSNTIRTGTMAMLKSLALQVASENIHVLNVAPGRIQTERVEWLDEQRAIREGRTVADVRADEEAGIAMRRYGTPEEFGKLVAFLLSPANSYMTGQTILADGGAIRSV